MKAALQLAKERRQRRAKYRQQVQSMVGVWLINKGFSEFGAGHYTHAEEHVTRHIGFQKTSGGLLRVLCHVSSQGPTTEGRIVGPVSDLYGGPDSPNGKKYSFGHFASDESVSKSVNAYCDYLADVVLPWLVENSRASTIKGHQSALAPINVRE